jgi:acetyl esterase
MRRLRDDAGHSRIHGLSPQARTFAHAGRCGGSLSTSSRLQELSNISQRPSLHRLLSKPTRSAELGVRIGHPHLKLDRETEALLYWASSSTATPLWNLSPDAAREEYRRTLAKTEIKPPGIDETSELAAPGPAGPLRLRKYVPADPDRAAEAAILFVHGGGCVIGDLETHDVMCRTLCHDTRATVFSLDYRLAPEHPFPAAVEDTVAALEWLSHEASALGLDPQRIAIVGDSAGGGLAAVALHETKGRLAAPIRAQALIYPALDLRGRLPSRKELAEHFPIPRDMIDWFFDHYFGRAWPFTDPRAIPALYENYTGLPPALIITAGHDPLRDEGAEYAQTLAASGVPVAYECCEGTIHGFMNMGRVLRTAHGRARRRIATWLAERLREA